jgi:hypothetical protein
MKRVAARRRYHSPPGRLTQIPDLRSPHRQQSSACNANHILSATVAFTGVNQNRRTAKAPYSHDQLLQMNARFVQRLERAFANGDESRAAARATYRKAPAGPLMPPVERGDG